MYSFIKVRFFQTRSSITVILVSRRTCTEASRKRFCQGNLSRRLFAANQSEVTLIGLDYAIWFVNLWSKVPSLTLFLEEDSVTLCRCLDTSHSRVYLRTNNRKSILILRYGLLPALSPVNWRMCLRWVSWRRMYCNVCGIAAVSTYFAESNKMLSYLNYYRKSFWISLRLLLLKSGKNRVLHHQHVTSIWKPEKKRERGLRANWDDPAKNIFCKKKQKSSHTSAVASVAAPRDNGCKIKDIICEVCVPHPYRFLVFKFAQKKPFIDSSTWTSCGI